MEELLERYESAPARPPATDSRQTLLPMLDGLSRALGFERALVALYDPQARVLRGRLGLNVPESIAESLEVPVHDLGHPLTIALRDGLPQRVDDAASDARLPDHHKELLLELGFGSFVVAPLRAVDPAERAGGAGGLGSQGDAPAAGVVLLSRDGPIRDADLEWLMPFANQAGEALARARDVELLRDSSERHAVEKEWLWWMVNAGADPVVLTDGQNDIIFQNLRAENLFRVSAEDSEGKRHAIWMNNFLFTAALSAWNLEQGSPSAGRELTLVDPIEGTELIFEVISHPAHNYLSGARGTASVLKNVTDLRHVTEELSQNVQRLQSADEEIRLERDRLHLILRNVASPIMVMDNDNHILTTNEQAARLFQTVGRATALSRRDQVALSNDAKFTSFIAQFRLETAQVKSGELDLADPDTEEPLAMAITCTELRDDKGAVVGTVSVLQDVTRTRELERRRVEQILFESEKLAATGRLAASIAHEINNPLEAIKNSLYLLAHRIPDGDDTRKFLQIATKETERVSRILRQMLGFYRPAASMEATDLNALIQEAEALLEKHLRARGVRVENDLDGALPRVRASADQLKQVILNLILNAQEALPHGGSIYVSTRLSPDAEPELVRGDAVLIQIRDTGTGIAEEHVPHLFEPFFSTKSQGKGTGLGLWVSFGIVQSHGGTIKVRSRLGRGTTFSITLPIGGPPPDGER
jgi:signal transduction histidine kinase